MELVTEEKLVVIATAKPILTSRYENLEETLFHINSDVDFLIRNNTDKYSLVSCPLVLSTLEFRKI